MSVQAPGVVDVVGYAAAVRRALGGLASDQVEELTDGLEANLADAQADERHAGYGADLVAQFGSPAEYAAELQSAAGLPVLGKAHGPGRLHSLRHPLRAAERGGRQGLAAARATRWWPPVEDFGVAVRPAWWLLRGWAAYQVVAVWLFPYPRDYLPTNPLGLLVAGALLVASVQWGRGRWPVRGRGRTVLLVVSALTAILVLPIALGLQRAEAGYGYVDSGGSVVEVPQNGVVVDGMAVSNLFVYDAAGNPLTDVQIFDDRGRPVRTTYDEGQASWALPGVGSPWSFVPSTDASGRELWNVYPLRGAPVGVFVWNDETGRQVLVAPTAATTPPWPFAKAPAVATEPAVTPGSDGQVAPAPSGAATPTGAATSQAETDSAPTPGVVETP